MYQRNDCSINGIFNTNISNSQIKRVEKKDSLSFLYFPVKEF